MKLSSIKTRYSEDLLKHVSLPSGVAAANSFHKCALLVFKVNLQNIDLGSREICGGFSWEICWYPSSFYAD